MLPRRNLLHALGAAAIGLLVACSGGVRNAATRDADGIANQGLVLDVDVAGDLASYRIAFTAEYGIPTAPVTGVSFVFPGVEDAARLDVTLDGRPMSAAEIEVEPRPEGSRFHLGDRAGTRGSHVLRVQGPPLPQDEPFFAHWGGWHPFLGDRAEPVPITLNVTTHGGMRAVASGRRILEHVEGDGYVSRWQTRNPQGWVFLAVGPYTDRILASASATFQLWLPAGMPALDDSAMIEEPSAVLRFLEDHLGSADVDTVRWVFIPYDQLENFSIDGTIVGTRVSAERAAASPEFIRGFLAHELAHYWFGDLLQGHAEGARWLAEGFAEYWRYRYEDDRTGSALPWSFRDQAVLMAFGDRQPPTLMESAAGADEVYYQKGAAVLYALERLLGRDTLDLAMRRYVTEFRGRSVVPSDFFHAVQETTGRDMRWFEEQWLERPRGPVLSLGRVTASKDADGYTLTAEIKQQPPAYRLQVPVEILTEDGAKEHRVAAVDGETRELSFHLAARPTHITLDPQDLVFKWFHQEDLPVSFAQFRTSLLAGGRYFVESPPAATAGADWSAVEAWITEQFGDSLRALRREDADHLILLGPAASKLRAQVTHKAAPADEGTLRALVCRDPAQPQTMVVAIDGTPGTELPPIIPEAPLSRATFRGANMVGAVLAAMPAIGADIPPP